MSDGNLVTTCPKCGSSDIRGKRGDNNQWCGNCGFFPIPWSAPQMSDEISRRFDDMRRCEEAASRFRRGGFDFVVWHCFNDEDAEQIALIMTGQYPDVKCVYKVRFTTAVATP